MLSTVGKKDADKHRCGSIRVVRWPENVEKRSHLCLLQLFVGLIAAALPIRKAFAYNLFS